MGEQDPGLLQIQASVERSSSAFDRTMSDRPISQRQQAWKVVR